MVRTEKKLLSYILCPYCGEVHEYDKSDKVESLVCLYCDNVFSTADFQPYAITWKKPESAVRAF